MGKPKIRTDKHGNRYPLTPAKAKNKGGVAAAAVLVASVMTLATTGGGLGGVGTGADAVGSQALRAKTTQSKSAARTGKRDLAWRKLGLRLSRRDIERAVECVVNSYGQVQEFFLRTQCRSLDRTLAVLGDGQGGTFVVSVSWVHMRDRGEARRLRALADRDGTGNVAALGAVGPRLGDTRFTGEHYDSDPRGSTVVIAEAAPTGGDPDGALMDAATEVAVLFPPP